MTTPDKPIVFYNKGAYVKVENLETGVSTYVSKTGLIIQKNNDETFFLKSDSFFSSYRLSDVQTDEKTVDDLINWMIL